MFISTTKKAAGLLGRYGDSSPVSFEPKKGRQQCSLSVGDRESVKSGGGGEKNCAI